MKGQFYTLSVFYVIRREMIVSTTFANFGKGCLRYILVKVVEPNPTGRFKRTFKLSKPIMDVVTGFMDTV